ncbi:hypothetical protein DICVIV_13060 [Dictyocaulus viviparus]|uniref:Uncharacterized protein n=1 Tax=Dictyocaulus viviparus TaxID=29172 RepID=A0A0D8XB20_DICVI|nr:hypothetical protein DICVIV_13060 [Dictyocaulus viviparus]
MPLTLDSEVPLTADIIIPSEYVPMYPTKTLRFTQSDIGLSSSFAQLVFIFTYLSSLKAKGKFENDNP